MANLAFTTAGATLVGEKGKIYIFDISNRRVRAVLDVFAINSADNKSFLSTLKTDLDDFQALLTSGAVTEVGHFHFGNFLMVFLGATLQTAEATVDLSFEYEVDVKKPTADGDIMDIEDEDIPLLVDKVLVSIADTDQNLFISKRTRKSVADREKEIRAKP